MFMEGRRSRAVESAAAGIGKRPKAVAIGLSVLLILLVPLLGSVRLQLVAPGLLPTPSLAHGVLLDEVAFSVLTAFGDVAGLVVLVSIAALALLAVRRTGDAAFVVAAVAGSSIVGKLVKILYQAPRPPTV